MALKTTRDYRTILVPRFDGLGDLVLLSGLLRSLERLFLGTQIILLVRNTHVELARLLAPGIQVLSTEINPYRQDPSEVISTSQNLFTLLKDNKPDLLLLTAYNATWLDLEIANYVAKNTEIIGFYQEVSLRPDFIETAKQINKILDRCVCVEPQISELEKYAQFFQELSPSPDVFLSPPQLALPDGSVDRVNEILVNFVVDSGFVLCAPAGISNVSIKTWPEEKYVEVIQHILDSGIPVLIVGHESEKESIESLFNLIHSSNPKCKMWLGINNELLILVGLANRARLYLGNDTGLMHICSAFQVPVVVIFGGGTWPRFVPSGPGIALVMPLPCFYCNWECCFAKAFCLEGISIDSVIDALDTVLFTADISQQKNCLVRTLNYNNEDLLNSMISSFRVRRRLDFKEIRQRHTQLSNWDSELSLKYDNLQTWQSEFEKRQQELDNNDQKLHELEKTLHDFEVELSLKQEGLHDFEAELSLKQEGLQTWQSELEKGKFDWRMMVKNCINSKKP